MIQLRRQGSITGGGHGQQRDPMTGRFAMRPGFSNRVLAHMVGPKNTAQALVMDVLQRAAPQAAGLLLALLGTAAGQSATPEENVAQNGPAGLLR
jgi:hypothetical protein